MKFKLEFYLIFSAIRNHGRVGGKIYVCFKAGNAKISGDIFWVKRDKTS
jgi:hypothetical protein